MKYFANSILNYIAKKVKKLQMGDSPSRRMLIMIPAMPEKTLLSVAEALSNYCLANPSTILTLKIAKSLTDTWIPEGREKAKEQGWLDERGNLTFYRNPNQTPIDGKLSLVVLCGTDRVTDSAGLSDFHTCDLDIIWNSEMGGSFQSWINTKLQDIGIYSVETEELKAFDRLLNPLLEYGHGDLLQISKWLESLDLNHVGDVQQVQQAMLSKFDSFGLPSFARFPLRQKKKTLTYYIGKAGAFFNYTLFLETRERDKANKAIDKIFEALSEGTYPNAIMLEDEDIRGPYSCAEKFLEGLKHYIETDNKEEREKLLKCDFVTIMDKILKYRKIEAKEKTKSIRKISGSPVEMILSSVWQSMRDFYKDKPIASDAQATKIEIKCDCFKHDIEDGDDDSETALDSAELAREYLARLIGGLDSIVEKHLALSDINDNEIAIKCSLVSNDIPCKHSRTAEPQLEFSVYISYSEDTVSFRRKFAWRLPENHPYRLSEAILYRAKESMGNHDGIWKLPVFHLPYYDELLRASSDDEIRRVLLHCIRDAHLEHTFFTNLLSEEWLESGDSLLPKLKLLSEKYYLFIEASAEQGLLETLFNGSKWADLRRSYSDTCQEVAENIDALQSPLVGMMLRSFLIIAHRNAGAGTAWHADPYEQSGIVTILHPALLEMLEAQIIYLVSCFRYAFKKEIENNSRKDGFKSHIWQAYIDLSTIQTPLSGLLYNEEQNLDTNIRGQELIHRIGSPVTGDAALSTRLLLNYSNNSNNDNEAFSDSEMFRETSESKLLLRLMLDYFRLHPHTRDGISIAVFRNKDIQPIVAAVHHYLKTLADPKNNRYFVLPQYRRRPYAISVTIFTESNDDADVLRWIEQWRERWEAAETESKYQAYRECRFAVAHRLVEKGGQGSFQRLINDNFEADMAVFYNFIGAGSGINKFENVPHFDVTTRTLKFPILEKACCTIRNPAEQYKRSRVISNRQFVLGAQHANLMHCLKNNGQQTGTIVVGTGDFTPWRAVVDALHTKTEWVICIDPNMDERLLKKPSLTTGREREIIGFGSGVGTHGEDNYTISTEQFFLSDVHVRLCASIESLYAGSGWSVDKCQEVSSGVLKVARELSGLSLVRATGVDDNYIRDFMAYALSRKMLRADESVLCDNLISLDAYRHWFDLAENQSRPDLMWLVAKIGQDKRLHLEIHLIECKMAFQSEELILKARLQINNGLRVLMPAYAPIGKNHENEIEDYRPDRRYWWMQLHRLIASKAEIDKPQHANVLSALERLAEGDYDVTWNAAVFAFWINSDEASIQQVGGWNTGISNDIAARIYTFGSQFVYNLATDRQDFPVSWGDLETRANQVPGNICDNMEDIELPPREDDTSKWEDDDFTPDEDEDNSNSDIEDANDDTYSDANTNNKNVPGVQPSKNIDTKEPQGFGSNSYESISTTVGTTSSNIPERILLGSTITGNRKVYWEFGHTDIENRHMLIFGKSGMGKTYAIQCLLNEMGRSRQNSLIIDYTNGFLPNHLETVTNDVLKPVQHVINKSPLPINPFIPQFSDNGGILITENANSVAKRITSIFDAVYQIGDQQFSVLHEVIMKGIEQHGLHMNLDKMLNLIEECMQDKRLKNPAQTLFSKIRPFILDKPFCEDDTGFNWKSLFFDVKNHCHIFQLAGLDMHSCRLVTEFVLWDLYGYLQAQGTKSEPKVLVLDEVQNLDLREGSPLSKYLREGRKFGLSLIMATQIMSSMKKDERDKMFNSAQRLFFRPADTELKSFAEIAAIATRQRPDTWIQNLASLGKGECYSIGPSLNEKTERLILQAQRIKITSLEERGFNG